MTESVVMERSCFLEHVTRLMDAPEADELFDLLTEIALLRYECDGNNGFMLLYGPGSLPVPMAMTFQSPLPMRMTRGVRKMLQVSDRQLCLACDGTAIHGFATLSPRQRDLLTVQFHKHGMWELRRGESVVVEVTPAASTLPAPLLSERAFVDVARTVFTDLPERDLNHLWNLVSVARHQSRGTNILISTHAASEAERLQRQATRVDPFPLAPMLMERISSIDGTVILDSKGVCHAIGAILDGPATERGDQTRGGRYNSAVMFIDNSPYRSMIVVISQDGTADLVWKPFNRNQA